MAEEFALIAELQRRLGQGGSGVQTGIGDDGAVLETQGMPLVACTDTLVAGRHFFADVGAADLAWKSLAVNLSDLAAMGAVPRWALLNLALPAGMAHGDWVANFCEGWQALAGRAGIRLVGGDTVATDGPLLVTVTALGVLQGPALLRSGARPGDWIAVTGTLGDAALALERQLQLRRGEVPEVLPGTEDWEERRLRPWPRWELGQQASRLGLRCAADVSDGFLADLGHILQASDVGARILVEHIPLHPALAAWIDEDWERLVRTALTGGDDYELILCGPPARWPQLQELARAAGVQLSQVGEILPAGQGLQLYWHGQQQQLPSRLGHVHAL